MSASTGSGPLVPTFHGFVQNSMDGLILFEACLSGKLHHVPRRPHDRERTNLIKSGSIFIYEENASGIKRWTDGVAWSPSRILGNFLIYRELDKPFPPGEKKRAMKRKRSSVSSEHFNRRESEDNSASEPIAPPPPIMPSPKPSQESNADPIAQENDREMERQLIGSLVDSYGFRHDGLVKKTMSVTVNGVMHHLVSYYRVDDVKNRVLARPMSDSRLANISVRPDLYMKQNFRSPVEESEHYILDPSSLRAHPGMVYGPGMQGSYGMRPGPYMPAPQSYPMYSIPSSYTPSQAASQAASPPSMSTGMYGSMSASPYQQNHGVPTPQPTYQQPSPAATSSGYQYPQHSPAPQTTAWHQQPRAGSYQNQNVMPNYSSQAQLPAMPTGSWYNSPVSHNGTARRTWQ